MRRPAAHRACCVTARRAEARPHATTIPASCYCDRYGGLSAELKKAEKTYLIAKGVFTQHTPYLLGEPLVVPETHGVTITMSSENLLLNAYRFNL